MFSKNTGNTRRSFIGLLVLFVSVANPLLSNAQGSAGSFGPTMSTSGFSSPFAGPFLGNTELEWNSYSDSEGREVILKIDPTSLGVHSRRKKHLAGMRSELTSKLGAESVEQVPGLPNNEFVVARWNPDQSMVAYRVQQALKKALTDPEFNKLYDVSPVFILNGKQRVFVRGLIIVPNSGGYTSRDVQSWIDEIVLPLELRSAKATESVTKELEELFPPSSTVEVTENNSFRAWYKSAMFHIPRSSRNMLHLLHMLEAQPWVSAVFPDLVYLDAPIEASLTFDPLTGIMTHNCDMDYFSVQAVKCESFRTAILTVIIRAPNTVIVRQDSLPKFGRDPFMPKQILKGGFALIPERFKILGAPLVDEWLTPEGYRVIEMRIRFALYQTGKWGADAKIPHIPMKGEKMKELPVRGEFTVTSVIGDMEITTPPIPKRITRDVLDGVLPVVQAPIPFTRDALWFERLALVSGLEVSTLAIGSAALVLIVVMLFAAYLAIITPTSIASEKEDVAGRVRKVHKALMKKRRSGEFAGAKELWYILLEGLSNARLGRQNEMLVGADARERFSSEAWGEDLAVLLEDISEAMAGEGDVSGDVLESLNDRVLEMLILLVEHVRNLPSSGGDAEVAEYSPA